jgi:5-methylcytosine-specific restriction endonuclease McrA
MDSVMHHFENSLGVGCGYCHVRNDSTRKTDFVSDENPHKNKAREMMKMMDKINDKYFDVTGVKRNITTRLMVSCYTCHHGEKDPATIAPRRERPPFQQRNLADTTKKSQ